jgi:mycothiol synthase
MIQVRQAKSDADLEAWRKVRIAVLPNERTASVEELRRTATAESLMVLAEAGGEVLGCGVAGRSDLAGQGFVAPRVLPQARRRGVGTALLRVLADHVQALGFDRAGTMVDDPGSLAFAEHFGFREVGRDVEQVRTVGEEPWPKAPGGLEIVSLADRPDLFARLYHELALEAFEDFALDQPLQVSPEDWEREWITWPEGSFVALAGDELVGCAGLLKDQDRPDRAENSLTAVRRDWRRRGLASVLKQTTLAWAAEHGLAEIYTWTQRGNEAMQTVNEKLGYVTRTVCIRVRGDLPLPE